MRVSDGRAWPLPHRNLPRKSFGSSQFLIFTNDRSLTEAQIDTIVAWVDGGAPKGEDADLPPLPQFSEGWLIRDLGDPDVIVYMPVEVDIPAEGESSGGTNYYTPVPWSEVRYARALESKPSNRRATHHTVVNLVKNLPRGTVLDARGIPVGNPAAAREEFSDSVESAQRNIKLTGTAHASPGQGCQIRPGPAGRDRADAAVSAAVRLQLADLLRARGAAEGPGRLEAGGGGALRQLGEQSVQPFAGRR